ncbi:hypothetical protein CPLU01_07026 [Colletotrichum plurivorum]|uniref:Uncharacterized protein n=1 Tax=Colletotrichum plurivorum TaxID=2175906 RepID=A0A8H6NFJ0_9PEZI|nr:hypothetical protein CPLU01_07026 [Colletotrichum plurivorum]
MRSRTRTTISIILLCLLNLFVPPLAIYLASEDLREVLITLLLWILWLFHHLLHRQVMAGDGRSSGGWDTGRGKGFEKPSRFRVAAGQVISMSQHRRRTEESTESPYHRRGLLNPDVAQERQGSAFDAARSRRRRTPGRSTTGPPRFRAETPVGTRDARPRG